MGRGSKVVGEAALIAYTPAHTMAPSPKSDGISLQGMDATLNQLVVSNILNESGPAGGFKHFVFLPLFGEMIQFD